jgi:outer membrane beta-barrel protein
MVSLLPSSGFWRASLLVAVASLTLQASPALAQEPEIEIEPDEPADKPAEPEVEVEIDEPAAETPAARAQAVPKLGETRGSWADIVTVVRKPFLKANRLEIMPSWQITMNDNMIRHYSLDVEANYHLTDVLSVGVEGQFFIKDLLEPFDLVARQYRRLPTLNEYNWAGSLNFHYVPLYAKIAMFNRRIVHWETFITAGVGITQSEVIPRSGNPADSFTNTLITPNVGIGARVFLTKWITFNIGVKDYIFVDQFEALQEGDDPSGKLINHVMFNIGVSLWFPTSFRYTTFR